MAKHTKFGRKLIAALNDAVQAVEGGEMHRLTIREVRLPAPPTTYSAATVRATRDRIGVSQSVFARMLGVSAVLVQSWEQGVRKPAPIACRLLDEINANPRRWRRMLAA